MRKDGAHPSGGRRAAPLSRPSAARITELKTNDRRVATAVGAIPSSKARGTARAATAAAGSLRSWIATRGVDRGRVLSESGMHSFIRL
jgi:hypothetical protein